MSEASEPLDLGATCARVLAIAPGPLPVAPLAQILQRLGHPWAARGATGAGLATTLGPNPPAPLGAVGRHKPQAYGVAADAVPGLLEQMARAGTLRATVRALEDVCGAPFLGRTGAPLMGLRAGGAHFDRHEVCASWLRVALAEGDVARAEVAIAGMSMFGDERSRHVAHALPATTPRAWFERLPEVDRGPTLARWVQHRMSLLEPVAPDLAELAATLAPQIVPHLLVLDGAAGRPSTRTLDRAKAGGAELAGLSFGALLRGDLEEALAIGQAAVIGTKKRLAEFAASEFSAAYVVAAVAAGEGEHVERARAVAQAGGRRADLARAAAEAMLEARTTGDAATLQRIVAHADSAMTWVDLLVLSLGAAWFASKASDRTRLVPPLEHVAQAARADGYGALAGQLTAIAGALTERDAPPAGALVGRFTTRPAWSVALERLRLGVDALSEAPKPAATRRKAPTLLRYVVMASRHAIAIEPTTTPSGPRSSPRRVSIESMLTRADELDPRDRKVLSRSKRQGSYAGDRLELTPDALLELVGHPAVFGSGGQPLEIVACEPRLVVRESGDEHVVTFAPPWLHGSIACGPAGTSALEVAAVGPAHAALAAATGDLGLRVPRDGRAQLLETLTAVGARIHVDGLGGASALSGGERTADSTLRVMLFRVGRECLRILVRVRPLGDDGPALVPGRGSATVVGASAGVAITTRRDLAAERAGFDRLRAAHPLLEALPEGGEELATDGLESTLEWLLALGSDHGATLEWPSGDPLVLPSSAVGLTLRAKGGTDWFAVDGALTCSDETMLEMGALLARAQRVGRFITLDARRYVALTESVRRQLDMLAAVVDEASETVRMHPLVAHALGGDGGLPLQLDRKAAARMRPTAAKPAARARPLEAALRDYQREGVRFLEGLAELEAGAILADDMGLGKTVQALALLSSRRRVGPALVVAPTSVTAGWLEQAARFTPELDVVDAASLPRAARADRLAALRAGEVLVVSYGMLVQLEEQLPSVRVATCVFDEAQALKNADTQRARAARAVDAAFRVGLSGTPIENHLGELHALFDVVVPGLLGTARSFERRFAAPIRGGDRRVLGTLRALVRPFMLRRTKGSVLEELPPRTELVRHVEPTEAERAFYETLRRGAVAALAREGAGAGAPMRILAEIGQLRRAATDPQLVAPDAPASSKLAELHDLLLELREGGHRTLVFGQYLDALARVRERLELAGVSVLSLDGSTPAKTRAARVAAFQDGEGDVFLISLKAGGTGLNLTAADTVVLMDPWWNPAVDDQAADRVHRIGQHRPVTVVRLVTAGTLEERVLKLHGEKRSLATDVLEDMESAKRLDLAALRGLLEG